MLCAWGSAHNVPFLPRQRKGVWLRAESRTKWLMAEYLIRSRRLPPNKCTPGNSTTARSQRTPQTA
eukprot:3244012-Lingulodinium_polyedra.AAC.1